MLLQNGLTTGELTTPAEFTFNPPIGMQLFMQFIACVSQLI